MNWSSELPSGLLKNIQQVDDRAGNRIWFSLALPLRSFTQHQGLDKAWWWRRTLILRVRGGTHGDVKNRKYLLAWFSNCRLPVKSRGELIKILLQIYPPHPPTPPPHRFWFSTSEIRRKSTSLTNSPDWIPPSPSAVACGSLLGKWFYKWIGDLGETWYPNYGASWGSSRVQHSPCVGKPLLSLIHCFKIWCWISPSLWDTHLVTHHVIKTCASVNL